MCLASAIWADILVQAGRSTYRREELRGEGEREEGGKGRREGGDEKEGVGSSGRKGEGQEGRSPGGGGVVWVWFLWISRVTNRLFRAVVKSKGR